MNKKVYFITGGGTGGHIYPALAVADKLLKLEDTEKIYYIGNPNNLEATITKDKNYQFLAWTLSSVLNSSLIGFPLMLQLLLWSLFFAASKATDKLLA